MISTDLKAFLVVSVGGRAAFAGMVEGSVGVCTVYGWPSTDATVSLPASTGQSALSGWAVGPLVEYGISLCYPWMI